MNLLLDTHALIWSIVAPDQLSPNAREAIVDPRNRIAASAVSFWEISIKSALGKLDIVGCTPEQLVGAAFEQGFELLSLDASLVGSFSRLPNDPMHREPFDRMLVWQAMQLGFTLVSRDRKIGEGQYANLEVFW